MNIGILNALRTYGGGYGGGSDVDPANLFAVLSSMNQQTLKARKQKHAQDIAEATSQAQINALQERLALEKKLAAQKLSDAEMARKLTGFKIGGTPTERRDLFKELFGLTLMPGQDPLGQSSSNILSLFGGRSSLGGTGTGYGGSQFQSKDIANLLKMSEYAGRLASAKGAIGGGGRDLRSFSQRIQRALSGYGT